MTKPHYLTICADTMTNCNMHFNAGVHRHSGIPTLYQLGIATLVFDIFRDLIIEKLSYHALLAIVLLVLSC